jgi:glutamate-1-semialdehyde 2,1-aminomutase
MDMIAHHKVFHAGTYATNPLVVAAGLATFREVLTPAGYEHVGKISDALVDGYNQILKTTSIEAYVESAGANGALLFYPKRVRNFRDWLKVDIDLWKLYWFGMINQGVMAQPFWWDEQWTISMAHSFADVDKHLTAFEKLAPAIEQMQAESKLQTVS